MSGWPLFTPTTAIPSLMNTTILSCIASSGYDTSLATLKLSCTYTRDYFGFGGGHCTMLLGHTISVAEGHDIRFSVDRLTSLDEDKWSWDGGKSFNHFRVAYMTSWSGFDFSLAAEDTSMNLDTQ